MGRCEWNGACNKTQVLVRFAPGVDCGPRIVGEGQWVQDGRLHGRVIERRRVGWNMQYAKEWKRSGLEVLVVGKDDRLCRVPRRM